MPRSRSRSSRKKSVQRRKFGSIDETIRTIYSIKTIRDLGIPIKDVKTINHPNRLSLYEYDLAKQIASLVEKEVKANTEEYNNIIKI